VAISPSRGQTQYLFDVPWLKNLLKPGPSSAADLIVVCRGRSGQELRGWLEDAADAAVFIDPGNPPSGYTEPVWVERIGRPST
jgi:hypothetical protein